MNKRIIFFLALFTLVLTPIILLAQPGGGGPTPVPIDGGASILAAAGLAYGVKKYRDMKSK